MCSVVMFVATACVLFLLKKKKKKKTATATPSVPLKAEKYISNGSPLPKHQQQREITNLI